MKCDDCKEKMVQVVDYPYISYVCPKSELYMIWKKEKLKEELSNLKRQLKTDGMFPKACENQLNASKKRIDQIKLELKSLELLI